MKIKSIDKILMEIKEKSNQNNVYVIGERLYSAKKMKNIDEKKCSINDLGTFFLKETFEKVVYSDCYKLYFFTDSFQYTCLRADNGDFYYSVIEKYDNEEPIKFNTLSKEFEKKYSYAVEIGSIPDYLKKESLFIYRDKITLEWRYGYAE